MYLRELRELLIATARERVQAGELSERQLSKMSGVSQPHIHHILNSQRVPSVDIADRVMKALGLGAMDLLSHDPVHSSTGFRSIPLLDERIGPGGKAF